MNKQPQEHRIISTLAASNFPLKLRVPDTLYLDSSLAGIRVRSWVFTTRAGYLTVRQQRKEAGNIEILRQFLLDSFPRTVRTLSSLPATVGRSSGSCLFHAHRPGTRVPDVFSAGDHAAPAPAEISCRRRVWAATIRSGGPLLHPGERCAQGSAELRHSVRCLSGRPGSLGSGCGHRDGSQAGAGKAVLKGAAGDGCDEVSD